MNCNNNNRKKGDRWLDNNMQFNITKKRITTVETFFWLPFETDPLAEPTNDIQITKFSQL